MRPVPWSPAWVGRSDPVPAIRIVTDSATDIPPQIAAALGITVVPHRIRLGAEEYLDALELSRERLYERLQAGLDPVTSQPSVGAFVKAFQSAGQVTDRIVSIHASSRLTGAINAATAASASLPHLSITLLDSHQLSMAAGLIVLEAARLAAAGADAEAITAHVAACRERTFLLGAAETLTYALRGGRLGAASVLLTPLLRVKPIVQLGGGRLLPVGLARTTAKAVDRLAAAVDRLGPLQELAVIHVRAPTLAQELAARLSHLVSRERLLVVEAGPAIGAHAGPGAFGAAAVRRSARTGHSGSVSG